MTATDGGERCAYVIALNGVACRCELRAHPGDERHEVEYMQPTVLYWRAGPFQQAQNEDWERRRKPSSPLHRFWRWLFDVA